MDTVIRARCFCRDCRRETVHKIHAAWKGKLIGSTAAEVVYLECAECERKYLLFLKTPFLLKEA